MLEKPTKPIYKKDQKFNKIIGIAVKVIPENCSCWDKIKVTGSKTCQEIFDFLKEKYNINVDILSSGDVILINTVMPSSSKNLNRKLEDIYNEKAKFKLDKNYMIINIVSYIQNVEIEGEKIESASVDIPIIKYIFK